MEAPVPASALIHSATLVSAGIYLILRFKAILLLSEYAVTILPLIGSFTACLGALSSAFQTDAKRLLAYSTISHCGFLVVSAICCDSEYTIFYLYVHGFFKAASFICVGNVIRFNAGYQDIRCMGGYAKYLPFECLASFVCLINLGGLPFTFGYLYKFLFLNFMIINPINIVGYGLCIVGMLCSIVYVYKIIYYSCFDFRKGPYQLTIYLIQLHKNSLKNLLKNFTFIKFIAFSIIYLFAIIFFIIVKSYILKHYIFYYYTNDIITNEYYYLNNLLIVKSYLITIYFFL